ncbi:hypothetical protein PMZ80_003119 [Knufia obscura]|uniref:F-box domain-containing protein n=1 Tax=Knufia obscura TaxID=1635080 RepID=A0ABR0RU86_9EURO|nr:hypothetical protein PMZ80_003119 [Knufia obscura]
MATQPATFIKAIMSDQPQRPIEDLPVEIRSMILSKVSFAKENAVKDWLNLALTSHQFYKIVVSRSFCVQYLCNHPNPSMTLYRHLPGFYEPKAWVARYQHHLQTADLARTLFEIRRPRFEAHLTSIQQGELTEKLEHVFCTAYALLDLITDHNVALQGPSKHSLRYTFTIITEVLPDEAILLLRWMTWTFILGTSSRKQWSLFSKERPQDEHYSLHQPSFSGIYPPTSGGSLRAVRPGPRVTPTLQQSQKLMLAIECALLFGPGKDMMRRACDHEAESEKFSGQFVWFIGDALGQMLGYHGSVKTCFDNTVIDFDEIGATLNRRFDSVADGLGLQLPATYQDRSSTRGEAWQKLVASADAIMGLIDRMDLADVGLKLHAAGEEAKQQVGLSGL